MIGAIGFWRHGIEVLLHVYTGTEYWVISAKVSVCTIDDYIEKGVSECWSFYLAVVL